jgi:hypothetical protein
LSKCNRNKPVTATKTELLNMQQIENTTSPAAQFPANTKLLVKVSWFIRLCAVLVLAITVARLVHEGWPHSLKGCGSLTGLFAGTMLLVMSFNHMLKGRAKIAVAVVTIILGLWVILFSLAMLVLPHL